MMHFQAWQKYIWTNIMLLLLIQLRFRPTMHLKMTIRTSVLWKMNIKLAKKWPEMVIKWPNLKVVSFESKRSIFQPFHLSIYGQTYKTFLSRNIIKNQKSYQPSSQIFWTKFESNDVTIQSIALIKIVTVMYLSSTKKYYEKTNYT